MATAGQSPAHLYPLPPASMACTHNTYSDLLIDGGRLARTEWPEATPAEALVATLRHDPEAIVLLITTPAGQPVRGLAPGGLA